MHGSHIEIFNHRLLKCYLTKIVRMTLPIIRPSIISQNCLMKIFVFFCFESHELVSLKIYDPAAQSFIGHLSIMSCLCRLIL